MPLYRNDGAAWRPLTDVWVNDLSGTWRRCAQVWVNDGSAWRLVHQLSASTPLAATASPTSYSHAFNSAGASGSFSVAIVGAASGGAGGYSYAWSLVAASGTATTRSISGATLNLSGAWPLHAVRSYSETWRLTATDAAGASATFDVTVYVEVDNAA